MTYAHPLQTRLLNKHVGIVGHHDGHQDGPQDCHHQGETIGANFVVIEKVQTISPIFKVAVVVELYEEVEVSCMFILSPLCTIQLVEIKSPVLFI